MSKKRSVQNKYEAAQFGAVFALVCLILQLVWPEHGKSFGFAAIGFLALAIFANWALAPLNKAWMLLGHLMGRVVGTALFSLVFFGLLFPLAMLRKLFGKQEMTTNASDEKSFWIVRESPELEPEHLDQQF